MTTKISSYLYLHLAVFLYGFTGIFGQIIELSAMDLIFWRCVLSSLILAPFFFYQKIHQTVSRSSLIKFAGIGSLLGLHWFCFYGSIKMSNASIAMICLSMISVMTVFIEAIIGKQKVIKEDLIAGLMVIPGILLINQSLNPEFKLGFWLGILCALFSAIVATLNKKYIHKCNPIGISWIEITVVGFMFAIISLFVHLNSQQNVFFPSTKDWYYLSLLSIFCTVIPLVLVMKSMQSLSAFSTMLVFNLETVYGIILSIVILKEHKQLNGMFYVGVLIILASVFAYPFIRNKKIYYYAKKSIRKVS